MLIRYVCECCDRLVEEVLISEEMVSLLNEQDPPSYLTGSASEAIMSVEIGQSLLLETICPECLAEVKFEEGATLGMKTQILN